MPHKIIKTSSFLKIIFWIFKIYDYMASEKSSLKKSWKLRLPLKNYMRCRFYKEKGQFSDAKKQFLSWIIKVQKLNFSGFLRCFLNKREKINWKSFVTMLKNYHNRLCVGFTFINFVFHFFQRKIIKKKSKRDNFNNK